MISIRLITDLVGQRAPVLIVSLPSPHTVSAQASLTGRSVAVTVPDVLTSLMREIWQSCSDVLAAAFVMFDDTSTVTTSLSSGPVAGLWPTSLRASVCLAVCVFGWQLYASLRGRGKRGVGAALLRYGLGCALTTGTVSILLSGADLVARLFLQHGLQAAGFRAAFGHLASSAMRGTGAMTLGLVGLYGLLPTALGYAVVVIVRQVTILLMIATAPVIAVGLMTRWARRWFWITLRWILTAIGTKPVLALVLTFGFAPLAHTQGVIAVLAVVAILWVGLGSVWALYALLRNLIPATRPEDADHRLATGSTPRTLGASKINPSVAAAHWPSCDAAAGGPSLAASLLGLAFGDRGLAASKATRGHPGALGPPVGGDWPAVSAGLLPPSRSVSSGGGRSVWLPPRVAVPGTFLDCVPLWSVLDAGHADSAMTVLSRVRCHDGPPFRGRGRVCLMQDSNPARWAATAQMTHPGSDVVLAVRSAALLADHVATLCEPHQPRVIDRVSLLLRARPSQLRQHGRVEQASTPENTTITEIGKPRRTPEAAGVRYEVFVTVSGSETALGRAARAAGGGLTGQALALYRLLDVVDLAASSLDVGSLAWLSSPRLAQAVCAGLAPANLAGVADAARAGSDWAHTPGASGSPSAYRPGRSATVAYRVATAACDPAIALAALLDLATGVQTDEQQRCLLLQYDTALPTRDPRRDGPAMPSRRSITHPAASPRPTFPWADRAQTRPHLRNLTRAMVGGDGAARWHAGVACTVAASTSIEEHAARLEHEAAGRLALRREPDHQAVAACLPLGIGLDEASAAS